ncbi:putative tandem protein 20 [Amphidinium carterae]
MIWYSTTMASFACIARLLRRCADPSLRALVELPSSPTLKIVTFSGSTPSAPAATEVASACAMDPFTSFS